MTKNVLIIGAGIHGCFLAKYLNKFNINIYLIEKNKDICLEASGATHNRANRGFHYPRSNETTSECKIAYDYFEKKYQNAFGVIFDDIIAAGYALLAIYIINIIM